MTAPVEPTKVCAACGVRKPWSAFYANCKWDDGTMRRPQSRCKACMHIATNRRRAERGRNRRDESRTRYLAIRSDPERLAVRREQDRTAKRRKHGVTAERYREAPPAPTTSSLDAAPLMALLRERGLNGESTARLSGIHAGTIRAILRGERRPSIDTADRVCLALDVSLETVYAAA